MRLELEQNHPTFSPDAENRPPVSDESRSAEAANLLRDGIKAAQSGDRAGARSLLLRAAELDPQSEKAWLWLSSISEYPEELLSFLTRVLEINPENERAIEWSAATTALLAKNLVQRGIEAAESSQFDAAAELFDQAVGHDERNVSAWLWLASLAKSNDEKLAYYQKVLEFEPENETAAAGCSSVRDEVRRGCMSKAAAAAFEGRFEECSKLIDAVLVNEPDLEEALVLRSHITVDLEAKASLFGRILDLNPANAFAAAGLESLTVLRDSITADKTDAPESKSIPFDLPSTDGGKNAAMPSFDSTIIVMPLNGNDSFSAKDASAESGEFGDPGFPNVDSDEADPGSSDAVTGELPETFPDVSSDGSFENNGTWENTDQEPVEVLDYEMVPEVVGESSPSWDPPADAKAPPTTSAFANWNPLPDTVFETEIARPSTGPFDQILDDAPADQFKTVLSVEVDRETAEAIQNYDPFSSPVTGDGSQPDVFSVPFDSTFHAGTIPMPEDEFGTADDSRSETRSSEVESSETSAATASCAFCEFENDAQAISCQGCLAVLTLADLELILANQHADKSALRHAVEAMEKQRSDRELTESELTMLGIGHLNLRNLQFGFDYLQEASQRNPNNVVLSGQVHSLLIRLDEIKRQDENHEGMSKGKTILVVDDSPTVRKLIAGKLEKCGHEVHCTNDGVEAMERLADLRPDLVLLDINMPRMDGYQVCKLIRSNESTKDIPVIMISGKDGFFDKVRGKMAGSSGYITKPFGPETLMKTVETYLRGEA